MSDNYEDSGLLEFLQALDESDVEVTDWEAKFIAQNLDASRLSDRQRQSVKQMIEKYGKRIGWL